LGIDRGNNNLIILGAVPAALLAIIFDQLLKYLEKIPFKKTITILSTSMVVILLAIIAPLIFGEQVDLTIAGKVGAEPEILMNMYKLLIEDQTDIKTEVEPNFGETTFIFNATQSGDVDI